MWVSVEDRQTDSTKLLILTTNTKYDKCLIGYISITVKSV